jgi:broad specificity phosphatase PhoE
MADLGMGSTSILLSSSDGQEVVGADSGSDTQTDGAGGQQKASPPKKTYTYTYRTLGGYFLQDDPATDAATFDFMAPGTNFGLIDRAYESDGSLPNEGREMTQWQRFEHHVRSLNQDARDEEDDEAQEDGGADKKEQGRRHSPPHSLPRTRYLVFFFGRHGNGYHNIAERYYGSAAWDCHFSALDGDPDGIMTWADAALSLEGKRQARQVNSFWKTQTAAPTEDGSGQNMRPPDVYLVSPLDRTLETALLSFDGVGVGTPDAKLEGAAAAAVVMEKAREGTGIHTCDRRGNVTSIRARYPSYNVDADSYLTEVDEFWTPDRREPSAALDKRVRGFLDDLMSNPEILGAGKESVSVTSHSGAIAAMLRVLDHRPFGLGTGAVIPVLIKVRRDSLDDEDNDKMLGRRHGGSGEGANHEDPTLDLPDEGEGRDSANVDPDDRSKWATIPSCPADLDLATVGQKRWGMGLKEFLAGVEGGTLDMEKVPF